MLSGNMIFGVLLAIAGMAVSRTEHMLDTWH